MKKKVFRRNICSIALCVFCFGLSQQLLAQATAPVQENNIPKEESLEKMADDGKFENGMLFLTLNLPDKAVRELEEYLEVYNNGIHRGEALKIIAEIHFQRFNYQKAIRAYERLYEEFSNTEEGVEAYYNIGICNGKMGNEKKAATVYQEIITDHPESRFSHQAQVQLDLLQVLSDEQTPQIR